MTYKPRSTLSPSLSSRQLRYFHSRWGSFPPPTSHLSLRLVSFILLLTLAFACTAAPAALPATLTPQPTSASDNPTVGAARRATRQAATAAVLDAAASQTAEFVAKAAQTAEFQAAAQQAATATAVAHATSQSILAAKSGWQRRVLEPFSDNHMGWPVGLTQDQYLAVTSTVAGGRYQWDATIASSGAYTNLVPAKGPALDDFSALVTVTFVQGNDDGQSAYGLVFRQVGEDFGFFGILKSGSFMAMESHGSNVDQLIQDKSSAIDTRPGTANHLAVAAVGSDFVLLVNDQVVGQMSANLASGQVGVSVEALDPANEAQVDFSDFEIYSP